MSQTTTCAGCTKALRQLFDGQETYLLTPCLGPPCKNSTKNLFPDERRLIDVQKASKP